MKKFFTLLSILALISGKIMAQTVYTSNWTGTLQFCSTAEWTTTNTAVWTASGSGSPNVYVISAGNTAYIACNVGQANITLGNDTIRIYGELKFKSGNNDLLSSASGYVDVMVGGSITGGSGASNLNIGSVTNSGPYNLSGPASASGTNAFPVPSSFGISTLSTNSVCLGSSMSITYTTGTSFADGNIFSAELSSASGSFISPTVIGSVTSTVSGSISASFPNTLSPGVYYIRLTSTDRLLTTFSRSVTVNALPTANAGADVTICRGNTVQIGHEDNSGTLTYSWISNSRFLNDASISNPQALTLRTRLFVVVATDIASNCQSKPDSVTITVNPIPVASGRDKTICFGSSLTIGNNAYENITYEWAPETFLPSTTEPRLRVTPLSSISYTLTAIDNITGCSNSGISNITVLDLPVVSAGADVTICAGDTVTLGEIAQTDYVYTWFRTGSDIEDRNASMAKLFPKTTRLITLTGKDLNTGCTSKPDSVVITVNQLPRVRIIGDASVCKGNSITLTLSNTEDNIAYVWSPSQGLSANNILNAKASPLEETTYEIVASNTLTGCFKSAEVTITPIEIPVVSAGEDRTICSGEEVEVGEEEQDNLSYLWIGSSRVISDLNSSYTSVYPRSTVTISLIATDDITGCKSNPDSVTIYVNKTPTAVTGRDKYIEEGKSTKLGGNAVEGLSYSWNVVNYYGSSEFMGEYEFSNVSAPVVTPDATTEYKLIVTDNNTNCSSNSIVTVYVSSGSYSLGSALSNTDSQIEGVDDISTLKLYPNPASDYVNVVLPEFGKEATITVRNISGNIVTETTIATPSNYLKLDVRELIAGNYIVTIATGKAVYEQILVVYK
jgi:hypothetical protein